MAGLNLPPYPNCKRNTAVMRREIRVPAWKKFLSGAGSWLFGSSNVERLHICYGCGETFN